MKQVLFYLPIWHIPVYGYGVMMVIGFIAGMYLAQYLARRSGLDPETFANAAILAELPQAGDLVLADRLIHHSMIAGLTRIRQHQLVYAALKGKVGGELHALALETAAPSGSIT